MRRRGAVYEEIAEILGAKLGTVRSRIHRGRAMLRSALAHRAPAAGRSRYSGPPTEPDPPCADRDRVGYAVIGGTSAPRVSALLDGQLSGEEAERAWAHVHACHACRDLVEREGWVKTRLAGLSFGDTGARPPQGLAARRPGEAIRPTPRSRRTTAGCAAAPASSPSAAAPSAPP